ncbi:MAG: Flp pilus assembly complex ATPase component TadA, partial [Desulfobulbaceae bacterium]|nr:Flp pilus assembly complex ATPase component TadA [Desulfobulbaceae bacterium]
MNKLVFSGERRRIGEILVAAGKVEPMQLERALSHQDTVSTRVGEILVTLGYVSEDDIVGALAEQFSIKLYVPAAEDGYVVPEISEFFHRGHPVALVRCGSGKEVLLISDPTDGDLFAAMDVLTSEEREVQLTSETALKKIMADEYGLTSHDADTGDLLVDDSDVDRLKDMASEAPVIKYVNSMIDLAVSRRASDIHIEPQEEGLLVRFRVDGILQDFESPPQNLQAAIISRIKLMAALDIAERRLPQDGKIGMRISGKEIDLRVSTLPTVYGEGIVIRILEKASVILDLDHLGMRPEMEAVFRKTLKVQDGIILVTGPTGSGKTTTLYCALNQISNETNKVITIEDPVEYQLKG